MHTEPGPADRGSAAITLNHQIQHGGLLFDVQTEITRHEGVPSISSQLFFNGCVVVFTRRDLAALPPGCEARAEARKQHGQLIRALRLGRLDDRIFAAPGTNEFEPVQSIPSAGDAATREPSDTGAVRNHFARGISHLEQLVACWLEALRLDPDNARLRQLGGAACELRDAIKTPPVRNAKPNHSAACAQEFYSLGLAHLEQGRLSDALTAWSAATALDPSDDTIRTHLSKLQRRMAG